MSVGPDSMDVAASYVAGAGAAPVIEMGPYVSLVLVTAVPFFPIGAYKSSDGVPEVGRRGAAAVAAEAVLYVAGACAVRLETDEYIPPAGVMAGACVLGLFFLSELRRDRR